MAGIDDVFDDQDRPVGHVVGEVPQQADAARRFGVVFIAGDVDVVNVQFEVQPLEQERGKDHRPGHYRHDDRKLILVALGQRFRQGIDPGFDLGLVI